jgi:hypothetical protein
MVFQHIVVNWCGNLNTKNEKRFFRHPSSSRCRSDLPCELICNAEKDKTVLN